jgi:hypothetical protein
MEQPDKGKNSNKTTSSGCLERVIFILVWLWVVLIVAGRLASQIVASSALTMIPDAVWAIFPSIQAALLLLPLVPLAWLWRSEPWRSIYRTWLYAASYVLLLAPISMIFPGAFQAQAILNIILSLIIAALLLFFYRRGTSSPMSDLGEAETQAGKQSQRRVVLIALLAAAAFGIPWVLLGALGSLLDTILSLLSGLAFGLAASVGLVYVHERGFAGAVQSPFRSLVLAGFSAGVALFILSSGVGYPFGGIQLLLTVCIPPLGWLAVYLGRYTSNKTHQPAQDTGGIWNRSLVLISMLLGLAAAFSLALIDPDELALVISASMGEILTWALTAAAVSSVIAWLSAVIVLVRVRTSGDETDRQPITNQGFLYAAAGLAWLVLLLVYFIAGQPGFHGERVFVILKDQADLSSARLQTDPSQRRQQVYQTLVNHADQSQAAIRQDLSRFGIQHTPYYLLNALEVNGGPLVQLWLENRPEVDRVLYNPVMRPLPQAPPTASGSQAKPSQPQWNLTQIGADRVWQELGITGEGILIGQSDSGVQFDHPELADSYRGSGGSHDYNWYDPWNNTPAPVDPGGHGTHTLGSVLGNSTGVAPDAQWIACANLARNLGNPARYLDCMQFMLAPFPVGGDPFSDADPRRGAHVLNNSWGCPEIEGCDEESLQPAVEALDAAGIFVVASAGNDGPFCGSLKHPLAIYDTVLTVGAGDQSGNLALFSSRGPVPFGSGTKPNLVAPGEQVLSAMPASTYGTQSGTSMAGPHVAGTVALMWSANPDLFADTDRTRQILAQSAQPMEVILTECPGSTDTPSTAVGYGLVDAYAAVRLAQQVP